MDRWEIGIEWIFRCGPCFQRKHNPKLPESCRNWMQLCRIRRAGDYLPMQSIFHAIVSLPVCQKRPIITSNQVTSDGVPVIWHDDSVLQQGSNRAITSTDVKDMTLKAFQQVIPGPGSSGGQEGMTQLVRKFRGLKSRALLPGSELPW